MPNIKSQKDRVVQAAAEQAHNKAIKTNLKTVVKKADAAIDANAADKDATVLAAVSAIDKARAKGVIKKNTASRDVEADKQDDVVYVLEFTTEDGNTQSFDTLHYEVAPISLKSVDAAAGATAIAFEAPQK